ncbi:MAG: hypothetical protein ACHQSE_12160 [Gemmatimonadales bacterium]
MPASVERLERQVRILRTYTIGCTVAVLGLVSSGFARAGHATFDEIDVQRINIVEKDGRQRLVISNKERSPRVKERGVEWGSPAGGRPGLIYYNDEETEAGGLTFGGHRDTTGRYSAGGILTFDQFDQDQTVALQYSDANGRRSAGLSVAEFPTRVSLKTYVDLYNQARQIKDTVVRRDSIDALERTLYGKGRLFAGRTQDGSSQVILKDAAGNSRLRLRVDSAGSPRLEFLDASGKITRTVSDTSGH